MLTPLRALLAVLVIAIVASLAVSCSDEGTVILATGTTPYDTGLLDELVPLFEKESGHRVIVVPVGTGQALEMGRRGDADVVLTHDPESEERFVGEGFGTNRRLLMHNDFVIVGPLADPAGVRRANDAVTAMHAILKSEVEFISRGDGSGTNLRELALWAALDVVPAGRPWYEEAGQGMGATLQVASQRSAYALSDRGTYLALRDVLDLDILFEGDPLLLNIYHVMQVNPERVGGLNGDAAAAFVEFLVSDEAQALIGSFGVEEFGEPLFLPDAGKTEAELREPQ
jgi:tungstate transport system substrate-binding protein